VASLLRAGHTDYVLNDLAFDYMRGRGLAAPLIARLAEADERHFVDQAVWQAHLGQLAIASPSGAGVAVIQDPVQIATEGAQWGSIHAHGFLHDAVVLSDDAGQFDIGQHALCWVHAERLVHKLDTFTDLHRAAQQKMRKLIWNYYADLKTYRANPSKCRRLVLRARFDRIFRRTGFVTLDRLLARLHANKAELLMVLERPEIPLYPAQVRTRKSFGLMIRKLSVTRSQYVSQFLGTSWRRKVSIAMLKSLKLP